VTTSRLLGLTLVSVAALASLAARAGAQTAAKCYDCKGTGLLVCEKKDCKPEKVCGIKLEHKCDNIYSQECCRGYGKILCPKCKDPVVEAELKTELEDRKAWLDKMRSYDKLSQTRFAHVETQYWYLHCSMPQWKVGDATLNRVRIAHLWAERLHFTAIDCQTYLGSYPAQKQTGNIVVGPDEAMRTTLTFQGIGHSQPYKTLAPAGCFTTRPHEEFVTDELLHPHVVHNAAHVLLHATGPMTQEGFFNSWFHEAFAHWIEMNRFEKQRTFCWHEVANPKDPWKLADWKKTVYGEVVGKKDEPLAMIMTRDIDRSSARDRAYGWAFVEFMIKTRREEFKKFFTVMKQANGDTKKALQQAYGLSSAGFQEKWREYVLKTWAP
jgi:hypothetical protein